MSNTNSRKQRHFFGGTGFYIALFLCATVAAVAGYWSLLPKAADTADDPQTAAPPEPVRETPPADTVSPDDAPRVTVSAPPEPEQDEPVAPVQSAVTMPELPAPPPAEVSAVEPPAPHRIVAPLEGEVVSAFSVDELSYSETLGDWRTHDGVDIAAENGTHVLAACSGTVASVGQDDLLGVCVVLSHGDGYETTYASLQSDPVVEVGDYVSAGQVIGTVGTSSLAESSAPPHLHFSVRHNGALVDPNDFLAGEP